jgi:death on curing protein
VYYLSKSRILWFNRLVLQNGGLFVPPNNLLNEGSLDYIVEWVQSEIFGVRLCPTISDAVAAYAYHIINGHIFIDGCKRTAIASIADFLNGNGLDLTQMVTEDTLVDFAYTIAEGKLDYKQCCDIVSTWFVF